MATQVAIPVFTMPGINCNTRSKDPRSKHKFCRLRCGCQRESQLHLVVECHKLKFYRRFVTKFLNALGTKTNEIDHNLTWLFSLNNEMKPLNMPSNALLRIALRTIYAHLTKLEVDKTPLNKKRIKRDIAHKFMSRILAYQQYRRNYFYDKVNSTIPVHRSNREVRQLSGLGELSYHTGRLKLNKPIRKLLKKAGVWVDFNKASKPKV